ncbi:hypothetical protein LXL04_013509 [Taraxacum kok-saghyz]
MAVHVGMGKPSTWSFLLELELVDPWFWELELVIPVPRFLELELELVPGTRRVPDPKVSELEPELFRPDPKFSDLEPDSVRPVPVPEPPVPTSSSSSSSSSSRTIWSWVDERRFLESMHHEVGRRERERERESQNLLRTHIFPKTPKPLTFSKNRLRGAKNRSNTSPVAKKKFRKNNFFFKKKLCICAKKKFRAYMHILRFCFKNAQIPEIFLKFFYRSLYNTYLKTNFNDSKRFEESRNRFFERNNGLGDIGNWGSSRVFGNI